MDKTADDEATERIHLTFEERWIELKNKYLGKEESNSEGDLKFEERWTELKKSI